MANPMIPQGTLNRLLGSLNFTDNPQLNITASFLGKEGISVSFEGNATLPIETMSGVVTSPEPYQMVTIKANILRSQALASTFLQQVQSSSLIGGFTIYSDSTVFPSMKIQNGFIKTTAAELLLNGTKPEFPLEFGGYFLINNDLWS